MVKVWGKEIRKGKKKLKKKKEIRESE